ncbi:MAG: GNAT family N-acyltransferase [Alphaproteobacteria bacterium]
MDGLRAGDLEVRLAQSEAEIVASQNLRYRVFYEEMAAHPTDQMAREKRDFDSFDPHCDHILVFDHSRGDDPRDAVVGTYRLIRRAAAARHGGFYTAGEYDIDKIVALDEEILELGRSCVGRDHRNRPTMQIMWRGISSYVYHYDIQLMFGCASLPGTDIDALAEPLSYLHHFHLAPEKYRPRALASRYVSMDLMPADAIDKRATLSGLDKRATLYGLPPLIKGYLRLGGFIGDGAVVDHQFNTTDVCVLVKTDLVTEKYIRHFERTNHDTGAN